MNKKDFLAACVLRTGTVKLPDGGEVEVRELTVRERSKLREMVSGDPVSAQAHILAMGCPALEGDHEAALDLPGGLVSTISDAILSLSGLTEPEAPKVD